MDPERQRHNVRSRPVADLIGGRMDCCSVEFVPIDTATLTRTRALFEQIRTAKQEGATLDDEVFSSQLTDEERSFFWSPSEDERAEWAAMWFGAPPAGL